MINSLTDKIINESEDFKKYLITEGSFEITKEYSIIVDFKRESIAGFCFKNGVLDHNIDTKKCIELLEAIEKYHRPKKDFSYILEQYIL